MTFAELLAGLPAGLEGALLHTLRYDLVQNELVLDLEIPASPTDALTAQEREHRRHGRLVFTRLLGVDLTGAERDRAPHQLGPERISAQAFELEPAVEGAFGACIIRAEVGSELRLAACDVTLEWLESERGYR